MNLADSRLQETPTEYEPIGAQVLVAHQQSAQNKFKAPLPSNPLMFSSGSGIALTLWRGNYSVASLTPRNTAWSKVVMVDRAAFPHSDIHPEHILIGSYAMTDSPSSKDVAAVLQAIDNPRWDFRTVQGIAAETGLPAPIVREILLSQTKRVRKSPALDSRGRELFTRRSKGLNWREILSTVRMYFASPTS